MIILRLDNAVDKIKELLKSSSALSDAAIITVFPDRLKPTRLEKILVAVGIDELNLAPASLESSTKAGQLSIFADIFVPSSFGGGALLGTLSEICRALDDCCIVSIKAEKPFYNKDMQAVVLKTVITFSDRITFGGDGIE